MAQNIRSRIWPTKQNPFAAATLEALDLLVEHLKGVDGLISVQAQCAGPLAQVLAVVNSEEAWHRVREVEERLFDESPYLPIDLYVDQLTQDEAKRAGDNLQPGYALLWSSATRLE